MAFGNTINRVTGIVGAVTIVAATAVVFYVWGYFGSDSDDPSPSGPTTDLQDIRAQLKLHRLLQNGKHPPDITDGWAEITAGPGEDVRESALRWCMQEFPTNPFVDELVTYHRSATISPGIDGSLPVWT